MYFMKHMSDWGGNISTGCRKPVRSSEDRGKRSSCQMHLILWPLLQL